VSEQSSASSSVANNVTVLASLSITEQEKLTSADKVNGHDADDQNASDHYSSELSGRTETMLSSINPIEHATLDFSGAGKGSSGAKNTTGHDDASEKNAITPADVLNKATDASQQTHGANETSSHGHSQSHASVNKASHADTNDKATAQAGENAEKIADSNNAGSNNTDAKENSKDEAKLEKSPTSDDSILKASDVLTQDDANKLNNLLNEKNNDVKGGSTSTTLSSHDIAVLSTHTVDHNTHHVEDHTHHGG